MKKSVIRVASALFTFTALLAMTGCNKSETASADAKKSTKQELRVYSIIHDEETQALCDLFTEKTGIPVQYLRATTGELVNRVIAEKDDPQADVLLGGASSYHIQANEAGALQPYASPVAASFPSYAKAADNTWTGFCVLTLGIGINSDRFAAKFPGMEAPKTWDDLLNPAFKGEIVMTNPAASSTAYLFVQNQLQRLGETEGWNYLLNLAPLVGQFPDSGSAPAKLIGTGEYAIGVSYIHAVAKYKSQGFSVDTIAPPQSVGDVDCVSILKNAKNPDAAQKFVDFILDAEAQTLMSSIDFTIPVNASATAPDGSVPVSALDLIEYDSALAAAQKDEVLAKWAKNVQ